MIADTISAHGTFDATGAVAMRASRGAVGWRSWAASTGLRRDVEYVGTARGNVIAYRGRYERRATIGAAPSAFTCAC